MKHTQRADYIARALEEIAVAWRAYNEIIAYGRTHARTNRLRRAKERAGIYLRRAVWARQIDNAGAQIIYESAPPDPDFGPARWHNTWS